MQYALEDLSKGIQKSLEFLFKTVISSSENLQCQIEKNGLFSIFFRLIWNIRHKLYTLGSAI